MSVSFLLLIFAAGIFRYLAEDAKKHFDRRLAGLLPRNVMADRLRILTTQFPNRHAEFRVRGLPLWALHILLNACACAAFVAALWFTPPSVLSPSCLALLRVGGLLVVLLALLADLVIFTRAFLSTLTRGNDFDRLES